MAAAAAADRCSTKKTPAQTLQVQRFRAAMARGRHALLDGTGRRINSALDATHVLRCSLPCTAAFPVVALSYRRCIQHGGCRRNGIHRRPATSSARPDLDSWYC